MKILLIAFSLFFSITSYGQIITEFDDLSGSATYKSESPRVIEVEQGENSIVAYYVPRKHLAEKEGVEARYSISILTLSLSPIFDKSFEIANIQIDNQRLSKKVDNTIGYLNPDNVKISSFLLYLSKPEFIKIGQANTVSVNFSGKVFELSYETRNDMRLIIDKIADEKPPSNTLDSRITFDTVIYNMQGTGVNINSSDSLVYIMDTSPKEFFSNLRSTIEANIECSDKKKILLKSIDDLEIAKGTESYSQEYAEFMAEAATHATLLAPYFHALAQFLVW